MANTFELELKRPAADFIQKARSAAEKNGGTFTGDDKAGSLDISTPIGSIRASYAINGTTATITIHDKPFFLSTDKIKSVLSQYIS
jgi:hypothetical protein